MEYSKQLTFHIRAKHKSDAAIIILLMVAFLYKIHLANALPIFAISGAAHDDRLMIEGAAALLEGQWLGSYSVMTLIKGPFFPILLAFANFLGSSYMMMVTILYSMSCLFFVFAIKPAIKNRFILCILLLILLFNPVSISFFGLQRVYRNSITGFQVLIIFGGYIALLLRSDFPFKINVLWALTTGFGLFTFWITREDSIWVLPSIFLFSAVLAIIYLRNYSKRKLLSHLAIMLIPIFSLVVGIMIVSAINYFNYGIFSVNEVNNSNFSKVLKSIYSVKSDVDIAFVSAPRATMAEIYNVSPSLLNIKNKLESSMDNWTKSDQHPDDMEVEDGWFLWAFRDAVNQSGYYQDARSANKYYLKVHNEIETAFKENRLKRRKFIMPFALLSPLRSDYLVDLFPTFIYATRFLVSFNTVDSRLEQSVSDGADGIRFFEAITRNHAIQDYKDPVFALAKTPTAQINRIAWLYRKVSSRFFIIGFVCFFLNLSYLLFTKKKSVDLLINNIILLGMLLGMIILLLGISYTHVSAFPSVNYMYLSGGYPLVIAFPMLSIHFFILTVRNFINKRNDKQIPQTIGNL